MVGIDPTSVDSPYENTNSLRSSVNEGGTQGTLNHFTVLLPRQFGRDYVYKESHTDPLGLPSVVRVLEHSVIWGRKEQILCKTGRQLLSPMRSTRFSYSKPF